MLTNVFGSAVWVCKIWSSYVFLFADYWISTPLRSEEWQKSWLRLASKNTCINAAREVLHKPKIIKSTEILKSKAIDSWKPWREIRCVEECRRINDRENHGQNFLSWEISSFARCRFHMKDMKMKTLDWWVLDVWNNSGRISM